jgi:hypothetical protein
VKKAFHGCLVLQVGAIEEEEEEEEEKEEEDVMVMAPLLSCQTSSVMIAMCTSCGQRFSVIIHT